ncbi:MAG TPA: PilZ domain-containing protein [Thermoanaerobaculia bacterium]|nr:PilZ domain-containing protein [Thermoanaerobaculia bacterium]
MDDRRRAERFPLTLPIELGHTHSTTHDFSGLGVFFSSDQHFELDAEIDFLLRVPGAVNVRCKGHVVRVNNVGGRYGIAATIEEFTLDESSDGNRKDAHIVIQELRRYHPE